MDNKAITEHEEYRGENEVKIDFDSIPIHIKRELAAATLEAVKNFLKQPGGRKKLNEMKKDSVKARLMQGFN